MSTLINKNVMVAGHRTSMRLEPEMWEALSDICQRENCTISDICTMVDERRGTSSFTSSVRVFILTYFRRAVSNITFNDGKIDGKVAKVALSLTDGANQKSSVLEQALKEISSAA